jgi:hypothetical protein
MRRGESGDPKRGHRIVLAAQQYLGKLGHVANGVVAVTSQWTDGTRHVPVGVKPYRPASRLPKGKRDPAFHTKPDLAWELIEDARAAGIPFRLVVADCVYGENPTLEARLWAAHLPYVMGLLYRRPSHGTWQVVADERHPPAFTPAEAAQRLPLDAWQRTVRPDSHGKELVRYVAELELGTAYGPTRPVRLIAATLDPVKLDPQSTWYLATSLPLSVASPEQVYELYRLRDWIEHYYKPAKHELGWADEQMRPEQAIVRHWQLVMLAYTFSFLVGALAEDAPALPTLSLPAADATGSGGKRRTRVRGAGRLERRAAPRARVALSVGPPPALLAALVHRSPASRTGGSAGPRRPFASPCRPDLTNQR